MGWSYGENMDGKEIGYSVEASCEHPGCDKKIDRGLAYACGGDHGAATPKVDDLTDKEIDALPAATLARMRVDIVEGE